MAWTQYVPRARHTTRKREKKKYREEKIAAKRYCTFSSGRICDCITRAGDTCLYDVSESPTFLPPNYRIFYPVPAATIFLSRSFSPNNFLALPLRMKFESMNFFLNRENRNGRRSLKWASKWKKKKNFFKLLVERPRSNTSWWTFICSELNTHSFFSSCIQERVLPRS